MENIHTGLRSTAVWQNPRPLGRRASQTLSHSCSPVLIRFKLMPQFTTVSPEYLWETFFLKKTQQFSSLKQIDFRRASGMIKFYINLCLTN